MWHAFDERVLLGLRSAADRADPLGPAWLEDLAADVTALGSWGVLTLITLSAAGFLWLAGKRRETVLVLLAVFGGLLLSSALKRGIDRPRPDLVPHRTRVASPSFPSGHSMGAAATYLTLGSLLARAQPRRRLRSYVIGLAILLTAIVGVTRIYLGVHWPTDVVAGWIAGAGWALGCAVLARRLDRLRRASTRLHP